MRYLILAALLLAPVAAMADDAHCTFHADRNLDLDLSGVRQVRFVTHAYDLDVKGNGSGTRGSVKGKACGSSQEVVDSLQIRQQRNGDTLVVELTSERHGAGLWSNYYSDLHADASIPATIPVSVQVGSGAAQVHGVASLDSTIGSGELKAGDVRGAVSATIGSGSATFDHIGPLDISTVGSGSLEARDVKGPVDIGTVGSGEAKIDKVDGAVSIGTIGSGSVDVDDVKGGLTVRTKGSGDIDYQHVAGKVDVPRDR